MDNILTGVLAGVLLGNGFMLSILMGTIIRYLDLKIKVLKQTTKGEIDG